MKNKGQYLLMEKEEMPSFSMMPMGNTALVDHEMKALMELQLKMATTSINHEYARLEYEENLDGNRRDELWEYMQDCRNEYFEARETLASYDPYALEEFEKDLLRQKSQTFAHYNA